MAKVRTSVTQLAHEMAVEIDKDRDRGINVRVKAIAEAAMKYAKSISPEPPGAWPQTPTTGAYREAWHVEAVRVGTGRGWRRTRYRIVNDNDAAVWIEYGTGPDKPGSRSPWGPNTPTPEQGIAIRTAVRFGGHP